MSENLEQKIIDKIKTGSLSPKPRWHFLLKERLVWTIGALALLIGAAAVSVMLYLANNNDWLVYEKAGRNFGAWLLLSLPYFWLVFLALFLWLLSYNLKHTKKGYRYSISLIISIAIAASILLGVAFFALGLGAKIDDVLGRRAPLYDRLFNPHIDFWSQPEEGRLAGLVIALEDEQHFILADRERGEWTVIHTEDDSDLVIVGQPVRVVGKLSGEKEFTAQAIMTMKPGREFFKRLNPGLMPPPGAGRGPGQGPEAINCNGPKSESLALLLSESPEFRQDFEENLLANKEMVKELSERDPSFLPSLVNLGVSPQTISACLE